MKPPTTTFHSSLHEREAFRLTGVVVLDDRPPPNLRSCGMKVRYRTKGFAKKAKQRLRYGDRLTVYECKACQGFHLGNKTWGC